jgi:hypothetical protein
MSSQEYIRSITEIVPDNLDTQAVSSSSSSFFSNVTWQTWVIIILLLALLGINIFVYLAKGTQETVTIFGRIFAPILGMLGIATKQTIETSAQGAKTGIDIVADTSTSAIDTVTGQQAQTTLPVQQKIQQAVSQQQTSLDNALQNASQQPQNEVMPVDSVTTGKAGWCYIGEERGIRTCAEVGVNDTCMSGDIFPSQQICMNPNLRQ